MEKADCDAHLFFICESFAVLLRGLKPECQRRTHASVPIICLTIWRTLPFTKLGCDHVKADAKGLDQLETETKHTRPRPRPRPNYSRTRPRPSPLQIGSVEGFPWNFVVNFGHLMHAHHIDWIKTTKFGAATHNGIQRFLIVCFVMLACKRDM